MAIQLPDALTNYVPYQSQAKKTGSTVMGKDDFLKLLFTQLKYQDPQNPVDDREFAAQLAQFSTLEQMTNMSQEIADLKGVMEAQGKFSLLQAVGKTARAEGDALVPGAEGGYSGLFTLDGKAAAVAVEITDAGGTAVRTLNLGARDPGEYAVAWDGTLAGGVRVPEGQYRFVVRALDEQGREIGASTFFEGTITGMALGADPTAYIGNIGVPFSKITMMKGA